MFNLTEIKKVFLATFLLMAMVVFACPSYAAGPDCSTKTGRDKTLCEEMAGNAAASKPTFSVPTSTPAPTPTLKGVKQEDIDKNKKAVEEKAAAEKNREEEAKNKIKASVAGDSEAAAALYDKQQERIKKSDEAAGEATNKKRSNDGAKDEAQNKVKQAAATQSSANNDLKKAQEDFKNASTPEEMAAANAALKEASQKAAQASIDKKAADKDLKSAQKSDKKADKALEKEFKKEQKTIDKEQKAEKKVVDKEIKSSASDLKKANKDIKKLEEKCAKGKCDDEDLQDLAAARAKADTASSNLEEANAKKAAITASDADEEAEKLLSEEDRQAAIDQKLKDAGDTDAEALKADKEGQAEAAAKPKRCAEAKGVFEIIACKAMTTLADLREVVYLFAGFGLIAFAWSAIFNKISWKHFSQIAIALFLLSMMGTFIGYFGYDSTYKALKFGQYLADDHEHTLLTGEDGAPKDCTKQHSAFNSQVQKDSQAAYAALGDCPAPDVGDQAPAEKKKWSLKDLKGTVQAGIGAIQKANSAYQTAKSTVENVVNQAKTIGNAIKNGEGGLTGVLNTMNTVATASGSIMNSGQLLANNLAANVGGLTEDIKNAGMTQEDRDQRVKDKSRLDTLTKMCDGGACKGDTPNAKKLRAEMEYLKGKESTQDTKVNKWLNNDEKGGGATIMAGVNKVGNIGNAATNTIRNASNAAQNGATIGGGIGTGTGDVLGGIFGAATALGDITSMGGNPNFDFKSEGTKRTEKAASDKAAFEKTSEHVTSSKKEGNKTTETRGDGSTKTVDSATGTTTVKNKDGSVTTTSKGGSTVEVKADGTKVVTNSNGKVTTTTPDGKTTTDESNVKTKYSGDAKVSDQAKNKTAEQLADEEKAKKPANKAKGEKNKTPPTNNKAPAEKKKTEPSKPKDTGANNSSQGNNEYNGPLLRPENDTSYKGTDGYNFPGLGSPIVTKDEVTDGKDTGIRETVTENGVKTTTSVIYKDTIRNQDGSMSQKDAEGRTMTTYSDGRIVIKDKNGKVTYDSTAKK